MKGRNKKLIIAARDGNLKDVKIWLGNGANIDYEEYGMTAFMFAAREGHMAVTRLLLENRCKNDITDRAGRTVLHLASQYGHLEITRYLVEVGGFSPLVETHQGQTPYNLAAEWKMGQYEKVMEYLQTAFSENSSGGTAGQEKEDVMVPSEIKLMADKRSIDVYLKLLESGSEKKRDIRLVVVGKRGSGKTSLIRRLFGEDITNVTSTNGIEIHKIKCKAMSDDGIWDKLDGKNEESKIHARILKPIEGMLSCQEKENTKTSVNEAGYCEANKPGKFVDELNELETEKVNPEVEFTVPTQQPNKVFELAEQDFKTMLKSEVDFDDKEEYVTLLLWDFAGDEEFYHTHQTFLSPNAVYLVVTKLNEADDKKAQEMFQLWMNSIHCYCRLDDQKNNPSSNTTESDERMRKKTNGFDPPVVLVGSHKDKIKPIPGEELVNACKKCIDTYVNEVPRDAQQHIHDEHFVSNTVMTENEDLIFQKIRQAILVLARKMRTWNTDYPLKFIQLEKHLQKKKELPIISFQELSQIANEIPMPLNEKELMMFLKFHHETRTLVYFDDLPDYIILDTQWLSDIFKCIITTKKFQLNVSRHQFPCEWDDFNMKGKLHSVVLDQILETNSTIFKFEERLNSYKHKDHILSVMEKFDIIISPNISDKDADDDNPPYYVPCMIEAEPESDIFEMFHVSDTCNKSTWLCFKFTFLPPHLKNHLIASLSRKYEIADVPVCEPNKRPIALFKSIAVFQLHEATKLLVMSFVDHIQIQVWEFGQYDNIDKSFYRNIADFVIAEIKNIISKRFKMTTVIFDQKLECCLQKPDCVKGSCVWLDKTSDYFCDICTKRHDNEWSEHQPVQKQNHEPIGSESVTYSLEDDTKQHKIDFNDILDEMMTRLVISVDDRRCIELNVSQETMEQQLLEIVNKRGEPNKTVCIDVLKQISGYEDLTTELKKTLSVTSPTDNRDEKKT